MLDMYCKASMGLHLRFQLFAITYVRCTLKELKLHGVKIRDGVVFSQYLQDKLFGLT